MSVSEKGEIQEPMDVLGSTVESSGGVEVKFEEGINKGEKPVVVKKKERSTGPHNNWALRSLKSLTLGAALGAGTYGEVFSAIDNDTKVALKKIKTEKETQGFPVTALREIKILRQLKHVNIVDLREIIVFNEEEDRASVPGKDEFMHGDVFMVFEYCDYDLQGILKSSSVGLTEAHIKSFLKQLLDGTQFLHKNSILHRDIKSANILISSNNVLKIADWGLARFNSNANGKNKLTNNVVTAWYRAPELLCGYRYYTSAIDIWSIGCVFAEMKTRNPLFALKEKPQTDVRQMELLWKECGIITGPTLKKYTEYPNWETFQFTSAAKKGGGIRDKFQRASNWDSLALNLLEKLLHFDIDERVTATDALNDEYFYDTMNCEDLPTFGEIECARTVDVMAKNKAEYEKAQQKEKERQEYREKMKREQEATLARERERNTAATSSGKTGAARAGLTNGSKYKVVKRVNSDANLNHGSGSGDAKRPRN